MKERRCKAKLSDGARQCQNRAILGGTVCRVHGGSAPQVRKSARERLNALVEPAIEALADALKSGDTKAIIRTAQIILDRSGYGPGSQVEISAEVKADPAPADASPDDWLQWCTIEEMRTLLDIQDGAKARMEVGEPKPMEMQKTADLQALPE